MTRVAIIGGSGYTGLELLRLLAGHPEVEVAAVTSRQEAGRPVSEIFPSLVPRAGGPEPVFVEPDDPAIEGAEFVFTALPHKAAMEQVVRRLEAGQRVIDLSADFRLRDPAVYEAHYGPHLAPDLTRTAVYGLAEVHREAIRTARLVGNPGCYPTCALLPLVPLLQEKLIEVEGIIIDAKTGVSGAGRGAAVTSLLTEAGEDVKAYKINSHRHTPEIEQELSLAAGREVRVVFTPHLTPMSRGMLSTIYTRPRTGLDQILDCWRTFYRDSVFIRVLPPGQSPRTQAARGSNMCFLAAALDQRTGWLLLLSGLDNLTKGASGQALQCFNLMAGLQEDLGLPRLGLMP